MADTYLHNITYTVTLGFKKYHYPWHRPHGGDINLTPPYSLPWPVNNCQQKSDLVTQSVLSFVLCLLSPAAEQFRNISHIVARHSCPAIPPSLTEMKHFLSRVILSCLHTENLASAGIKELIRDPGGNILCGDRSCVFIAPRISVGSSSMLEHYVPLNLH